MTTKLSTPFAAIEERRHTAWSSLRMKSLSARSADVGQQADLELGLSDLAQRAAQHQAVAEFVGGEAGSPYSNDGMFLRDIAAADANDRAAIARLRQHAEAVGDRLALEGRAAGDSSSFGSLVPLAYLPDLIAPGARSARPVADLLSRPLPDVGMIVEIPVVGTAAGGEAQTAELAALTGTTFVTTGLDAAIKTVAAIVPLTRQTLDRAQRAMDIALTAEVVGALDATVEANLINGAGTDGTLLGLLNTASIGGVTAGTATLVSFAQKVAAAATASTTARGLPPDTIVMHPRRWHWCLSRSETVLTGTISTTPRAGAPAQAVGELVGLDVILSSAIPTTLSTDQDAALVFRSADIRYFESPTTIRLDADSSRANVLAVAYKPSKYVALAVPYPTALVKLTGACMAAVAS